MTAWLAFLREVLEYGPQILAGLGNTLLLAFIITFNGLVGGVLVFYLTLSPKSITRRLTDGYISFFIGTPLIVLLFLMYYGLPQWGLRLSPLAVAVIGFTLNVAAYNARYLRTAYNGLNQDELEAARAQGLSGLQVFRHITLPQTCACRCRP
jgi:polar amino acid transport system permease protein